MQSDERRERLRELSPAKRALLLKKFVQSHQQESGPPAITARRRQGSDLLSFAQQQLFYLYLLNPQSSAYNLPIALRLRGQLHIPALLASIHTIMQRHEVLRTTITLIDEQPVQVVAPAPPLTPRLIDLAACPACEQARLLDELVADESATPFDLTRGPLVRVTLLRQAATEHVLILNMHHIVSDGWSIGLLMQELNALYPALRAGRPNPLAPLALQYADYALWQRQWLEGSVLENHLNYWRQQLAGAPTTLDLPADHLRPDTQSYQGQCLFFQLPLHLRTALSQLGQREGATLFMTLLAAFQVLLSCSSGQEDFLIGTPVANRAHEETEGLIGCFINTLVLRSNLRGEPSLRTLVQRVRETCLQAYAHQELPFEQLVEALRPERNANYNPLFQVMFILQNAGETALQLPGLQVEAVAEQAGSAKFDLTLSLSESEQAFEGVLEYNSELFEGSTIAGLQRHFLAILQEMVANPDRRISEISLLSAEEERYLLHELNPPFAASAPPCCLQQLVEAQARRCPERVALVCGPASCTYRDLDRRANALARQLCALGVGPEVLVGICAQRSPELVIAILATLKAGGAYVPLDPAYPQERLAFILADTRAPVLLTQRAQQALLATYTGSVLWLDELAENGPQEPVDGPVQAANLAYVIYTSGSTGRPKGVAITHASAVRMIEWARRVYTETELQRVLAATSICFDLSIFEMFVPLSVGGSCVLVEHALQMETLADAATVTLINTVPSLAKELLERGGFPATVQTINLAGEALSRKLVQDLYAQTPARRVFNLYGPSEDTTYSTGALLAPELTEAPPIGRPIDRTRVYLLDRRLRPLPPGTPGELYIGGEGLARGYLRRPALTAERFLPDALSGQPGARLYRTGDLARYRKDGQLEFLGRLDGQVKVRGLRIELGEIETALSFYPGVSVCVVVVQRDQAEALHLVAYILPLPGQQPDPAQMRTYLQERLPHYMVPAAFILCSALPLTPSGKVDRRTLSEQYQRTTTPRQRIGPRDLVELRLLQLWEKVLHTAPIGVTDHFFELGGHSLLAIQLLAQMDNELGYKVPLSVLIQQGTIERIAQLVRTGEAALRPAALLPLQTGTDTPPFFCVHPAGGSALCYVDLARQLGRPFYGLQAEGLFDTPRAPDSLQEIASHYCAALQATWPRGPYLLGGWSLGGVIALEMAQQLLAQGQQIAQLLLIDSVVPALSIQAPEISAQELLLDFALHLGASQEQLNPIEEQLCRLTGHEQWACLIDQLKACRVLPPDIATAHLQQHFRTYQALIQAWLRYRPRPYPGTLTLLRASERHGDDYGPGWQQIVSAERLTVLEIPGDHYTLMRPPYVTALAASVRQCLATAADSGAHAPV
ncbi:MAG TPA: amino acid adenylation domain-containing protein [Ktedonobacteraceae bacterium]|jgi:amino acid adenylation domain-containing protein